MIGKKKGNDMAGSDSQELKQTGVVYGGFWCMKLIIYTSFARILFSNFFEENKVI